MLLNATAWQAVGPTLRYPEAALPIASRPSTGICFSGGGTRAYTAAMGQLAALLQLGLLDDLQYITGISGGSWATAAYSYAQIGEPGVAANDSVLLGPLLPPESLSATTLSMMNDKCARRAATRFFSAFHAARLANMSSNPSLTNEVLPALLHEWMLRPVGIPARSRFSWDGPTAEAIRRRNPALSAAERFVLPPAGRSYPIIGTALLGPSRLAPLSISRRADETTMLEVTPLYVGQAATTRNHSYWPASRPEEVVAAVGGLIEPFAFGCDAPAAGLAAGEGQRVLSGVPCPTDAAFAIEDAIAASGWFPGEGLSVVGLEGLSLSPLLGLRYPYWSPATPTPAAEPYLFADGGDLENVHLIGLLKRRVRSIVVFFNSEQPLHSTAAWTPSVDEPTSELINDDLPPFFGVKSVPISLDEKFEKGAATAGSRGKGVAGIRMKRQGWGGSKGLRGCG